MAAAAGPGLGGAEPATAADGAANGADPAGAGRARGPPAAAAVRLVSDSPPLPSVLAITFSPPSFLGYFTVFVLAVFVGFYVISNVSTPCTPR